jgi:hypothetical protein
LSKTSTQNDGLEGNEVGGTWSTHREQNRLHLIGNVEWKLVALWAV